MRLYKHIRAVWRVRCWAYQMSLDSSMFFRVSPFFSSPWVCRRYERGGDQSAKRKNLDPSVCCAIDTKYVAIPSTHIRIQSCGWLVDNNAVISRWLLTQCTCAPTALNCIDDACLYLLRLYIYLILFDSRVYPTFSAEDFMISIEREMNISRVSFVNFDVIFFLIPFE